MTAVPAEPTEILHSRYHSNCSDKLPLYGIKQSLYFNAVSRVTLIDTKHADLKVSCALIVQLTGSEGRG